MVAFHCQLLRKRSEYEVVPSNADVGDVHPEHEDLPRSYDTESSCSSPTSQSSSHPKPFISCQPPSPSTPAQEGTLRNVHHDLSRMSTGTNPDTECSLRYQSSSTSFDANSYTDIEADVVWRSPKSQLRDEEQTVSSFECGKQQHAEHPEVVHLYICVCVWILIRKYLSFRVRNSDSSLELRIDSIPHSLPPEWSTNPNNLSEQIVQCMKDISDHSLKDISSPNSPFGHHLASSSLSSVSESSLLSFARSPLEN